MLERVSGLVELMLRHVKNTASDDFLGRLRDPALDDGGLMIRPEDGARGEFGEDALGALGLVVARVGGVALALRMVVAVCGTALAAAGAAAAELLTAARLTGPFAMSA